MMARQHAAIVALILVLLTATPLRAGPSLVIEADSGKILYADDAVALWYPASLTKLMTSYVTFKAIKAGRVSLKQRLNYSSVAAAQPASKLGRKTGSQLNLETALQALIVKSANDVAVMIAETVSGDVASFVWEMNRAASELDMTQTRFANPHGLPDPQQVTSARDMAILSRAIIRDFPQHQALFAQQSIKFGGRRLRSHNRLLGKFAGADGMKTGYICASGFNIVASASRGKRRLIGVVLGARSAKKRNAHAQQLLERGFSKKGFSPNNFPVINKLPERKDARPPTHMGPILCRRKYPSHVDPREIDNYQLRVTAMREHPPQPTIRPSFSADTKIAHRATPAVKPGDTESHDHMGQPDNARAGADPADSPLPSGVSPPPSAGAQTSDAAAPLAATMAEGAAKTVAKTIEDVSTGTRLATASDSEHGVNAAPADGADDENKLADKVAGLPAEQGLSEIDKALSTPSSSAEAAEHQAQRPQQAIPSQGNPSRPISNMQPVPILTPNRPRASGTEKGAATPAADSSAEETPAEETPAAETMAGATPPATTISAADSSYIFGRADIPLPVDDPRRKLQPLPEADPRRILPPSLPMPTPRLRPTGQGY